MIRVLVADDHLIVREGLRTMLEIQPDMEIAGEAKDGEEAVRLARQLAPDVILMDLRMPRMDGLAAIRAIRQTDPDASVVILTTYDDDAFIIQGLRAGAKGYLLKDASRDALLGAIRAAACGETLLTHDVVTKLMLHVDELQTTPVPPTLGAVAVSLTGGEPPSAPHGNRESASVSYPSREPAAPQLTDRELAVLLLVAEGKRSKEIALDLGITERTVKAHLTAIFTKLGASSRAEAITRAVAAGLLRICS